jgi:hypothetical protein
LKMLWPYRVATQPDMETPWRVQTQYV